LLKAQPGLRQGLLNYPRPHYAPSRDQRETECPKCVVPLR